MYLVQSIILYGDTDVIEACPIWENEGHYE